MKNKDIIEKKDTILLMSLQEKYFLSMINGEKKYEYRKKYRKEKPKPLFIFLKPEKVFVLLLSLVDQFLELQNIFQISWIMKKEVVLKGC
ncbi:hypothetical protein ACFTQ7_04265 [Lysinibacillus sp. NPDC056959]|uniref:hypothetical protein n=1 Tax=Lysinibacillus sp. NPDC056959 TaxID=3345981 RepID=UPI00362B0C99